MNIGIITFQRAENFGSALQAYALQNYLTELGHQVEIIDYVFPLDMRQYKVFRTHLYRSRPKALLGDLAYFKVNRNRKKIFKLFREQHLNLTKEMYLDGNNKLALLNDKFDCFICGSDQIWNFECTGGIVPEYFLSFVADNKLKVAYAPSMPGSAIPCQYHRELKQLIDRLDYVSVREKKTLECLKTTVGIRNNIFHVCDPTLFFNKEDYIRFFSLKRKSEKYIFVYILGDSHLNNILINEALRVKREKGIVIKYIFMRKIKQFARDEYHYGCGPIEFLELIYNAEYVITDSFHATVFSVLFGKRFYVFPRLNSSSRMTELLDSIDMSENYYEDGEVKDWENYISNEKIIKQLSEVVYPSKEYLINILGELK